jgi:hypothetical protein
MTILSLSENGKTNCSHGLCQGKPAPFSDFWMRPETVVDDEIFAPERVANHDPAKNSLS